MRVYITAVDPAQRLIHAVGADGGAKQLSVFEVPAYFIWPQVGEQWTAYEENGYWYLGHKFLNPDDSAIFESLNPGDSVYFLGQKEFLNVLTYGARGDGLTDDTAAIQAALDDAVEGDVVLFPRGEYGISGPLYARRNVTLRGVHAPRWPYRTGTPSVIRALSGFTGAAMLHIRSYAAEGVSAPTPVDSPDLGSVENDGGAVEHLSFDGDSVSGTFHGIYVEGECRAWRFENVTIRKVAGTGFKTATYSSETARGLTMKSVTADRCGANGFSFNSTNDSYFEDLLAVANTNHGIYMGVPGENHMVACRAVFNGGHGFYITGASYGGHFTGLTTDRNEQDGIHIDCTGSRPLVFTSCALRRDGRNSNSGGGNYAAVQIIACACPVLLRAITTMPGVDDNASGVNSPVYGVRISSSTYVSVDGYLWGATRGIEDAGSNTKVEVSINTALATGTTGSPTKWSRRQLDEAYAASITPNPLKGEMVKVGTLTGDITVNAPSPAYAGMRLGFLFQQDGSGGHAVTFDSVFKTAWTPSTTASKRNAIEFVYDGSAWVQVSSSVGM